MGDEERHVFFINAVDARRCETSKSKGTIGYWKEIKEYPSIRLEVEDILFMY